MEKSMYNLEFERKEYWAVDSSFNSNLFRIFKSYKSARTYMGTIKNYLLLTIENLKFLELEKDEDDGMLTMGFWQQDGNMGSRYELRLYKLKDR